MKIDLKNKFNVVIDTNVIVASLLTSHMDSSTVKVMDLFYEIVLDKRIEDGKLITGNIKHFPNSAQIVTPNEFLVLYESAK